MSGKADKKVCRRKSGGESNFSRENFVRDPVQPCCLAWLVSVRGDTRCAIVPTYFFTLSIFNCMKIITKYKLLTFNDSFMGFSATFNNNLILYFNTFSAVRVIQP